MKEGVYLLILPGDDFGTPQVIRDIDGGTVLVGVDGVRLLSNLPEGYRLVPMVMMTPERVNALEFLLKPEGVLAPDRVKAKRTVRMMIEEAHHER